MVVENDEGGEHKSVYIADGKLVGMIVNLTKLEFDWHVTFQRHVFGHRYFRRRHQKCSRKAHSVIMGVAPVWMLCKQ